jgi:hypothetical protein
MPVSVFCCFLFFTESFRLRADIDDLAFENFERLPYQRVVLEILFVEWRGAGSRPSFGGRVIGQARKCRRSSPR